MNNKLNQKSCQDNYQSKTFVAKMVNDKKKRIFNATKVKRAVVVLSVALLLLALMLKPALFKKPIFVFGYAPCVVATSSMTPSYSAGSMIILKRVDSGLLKEGDVIAFRSKALGGAIALHRITSITAGGFLTKGDQNNYDDGQLITASDYVGKCVVNKGLPLGGFAKIFIAKRSVFYILCLSVVVWAAIKARRLYVKIKNE